MQCVILSILQNEEQCSTKSKMAQELTTDLRVEPACLTLKSCWFWSHKDRDEDLAVVSLGGRRGTLELLLL